MERRTSSYPQGICGHTLLLTTNKNRLIARTRVFLLPIIQTRPKAKLTRSHFSKYLLQISFSSTGFRKWSLLFSDTGLLALCNPEDDRRKEGSSLLDRLTHYLWDTKTDYKEMGLIGANRDGSRLLLLGCDCIALQGTGASWHSPNIKYEHSSWADH